MSINSLTPWESIATLDLSGTKIEGPWHFVIEFDETWSRLKFVAEGEWSCLGPAIRPCCPNGHSGLSLAPEQLLLPSAAAGSLIGKFGGSVLDRDPKSAFAIGRLCFASCPDAGSRQLFIGVNGSSGEHSATLERAKLSIFGVVV